MKDIQKSKCYRWENKLRGANMAENEVIYLVRYLDWKVRNMPSKNRGSTYNANYENDYFQNRVCFIKSARNAHSWSRGRINGKKIVNMKLPPWALDYAVVLHEFAHSIEPLDGHGAVWMSTFCILLNRFHPDHPSLEGLAFSLDISGIKYVPFKDNPWYRGFCRVKFDRNKAPAFTRLIAQSWKQGKEDYGRKNSSTNYKLRLNNFVKKHKDLIAIEDDTWMYDGWLDGTYTVFLPDNYAKANDMYRETFSTPDNKTPDEKQKFWKGIYEFVVGVVKDEIKLSKE